MAKFEKERIITTFYLKHHPEVIFVYGENCIKKGYAGAAICRNEPNSYGFETKKYPNNLDGSFYTPNEYEFIFINEVIKLKDKINRNPDKTFLISKLGAGLANKYNIWEKIIKEELPKELEHYHNVIFLWE